MSKHRYKYIHTHTNTHTHTHYTFSPLDLSPGPPPIHHNQHPPQSWPYLCQPFLLFPEKKNLIKSIRINFDLWPSFLHTNIWTKMYTYSQTHTSTYRHTETYTETPKHKQTHRNINIHFTTLTTTIP